MVGARSAINRTGFDTTWPAGRGLYSVATMSALEAFTLRLGRLDELPFAIAIDDAAALLFAQAGLSIDVSEQHPFVVAERARWRLAIEVGELWFACSGSQPVGFCALGRMGDLAYLEQLSVHPDHGRRGVGAMLLEQACAHSHARADRELWLTTYAHFAWNKPFYERHGFAVISEASCSRELQDALAEQRAVLPAPEQRIAMRREHAPSDSPIVGGQ